MYFLFVNVLKDNWLITYMAHVKVKRMKIIAQRIGRKN